MKQTTIETNVNQHPFAGYGKMGGIDIGSRELSMKYADRVRRDWSVADANDLALPDGDRNAIRVKFHPDSGAEVECNGRIGLCSPWLEFRTFD